MADYISDFVCVCLCVIKFCKQDISKTNLWIFIHKIYIRHSSHATSEIWLTVGADHVQDGWLSDSLVSIAQQLISTYVSAPLVQRQSLLYTVGVWLCLIRWWIPTDAWRYHAAIRVWCALVFRRYIIHGQLGQWPDEWQRNIEVFQRCYLRGTVSQQPLSWQRTIHVVKWVAFWRDLQWQQVL